MEGQIQPRVFICKNCQIQATNEDIAEKVVFVDGVKRKVVVVWCRYCNVHSHFLKKGVG